MTPRPTTATLVELLEAWAGNEERRGQGSSNPYLVELLRHAADALGATQWQPMETAPKDGTPILIDFGGIGIHRVFWSEEPFGPGIGSWCVTDIKFEDRPLRGYTDTDERGWMPLPAPSPAAARTET